MPGLLHTIATFQGHDVCLYLKSSWQGFLKGFHCISKSESKSLREKALQIRGLQNKHLIYKKPIQK